MSNLSEKAPKRNHAGGSAWDFTAKERLVEVLTLGVLGNAFYANAEDLAGEALAVLEQGVAEDPWFVARAASYAREKGLIRSAPILALAVLSRAPQADRKPFYAAFDHVIRTTDDLRNFMVLCKGPSAARRTFGGCAKIAAREWIRAHVDEYQAMKYATGSGMTLRDMLRLTKPVPRDEAQSATFAWAVGKEFSADLAPRLHTLELLRQGKVSAETAAQESRLPFEVVWDVATHTEALAATMALQAPHMNLLRSLNTYGRAGAFNSPETTAAVAARLSDPETVRNGKQFPFRYLDAAKALSPDTPQQIRDAVYEALEIAVGNLPALPERTVISPDLSGSMTSMPVSGGATAADVACLFSAALWKSQPNATVMPFAIDAEYLRVTSTRDSVMTIAGKIRDMAPILGGGTRLAAPIQGLGLANREVDLFVGLTDNESWYSEDWRGGSSFLSEWRRYRSIVAPGAKAVLIQLVPYGHASTPPDEAGVTYVFGWSPSVVAYVAKVASGAGSQVADIEDMAL